MKNHLSETIKGKIMGEIENRTFYRDIRMKYSQAQ